MGLTGFIKYQAWFFDNDGEFYGQHTFSKKDTSFSFENKKYVFDIKNQSYKQTKGIFYDTRHFFYNVNNPEGILLNKKRDAILDAETLEIMMETNMAKKLNDLAKGKLSDLLTPKNILIAVGVIVFVYIVSSSGGLF